MEEDASDIEYARMVAKHINSVHHEVIIPVSEWISCLPDVVRQIETYGYNDNQSDLRTVFDI